MTRQHAEAELNRWQQIAAQSVGRLLYHQPTLVNQPSRPVVLGNLAHVIGGLDVVYEDAPNSLREVEATTTFRGWKS